MPSDVINASFVYSAQNWNAEVEDNPSITFIVLQNLLPAMLA